MDALLLIPIALPMAAGVSLLLSSFRAKGAENQKKIHIFVGTVVLLSVLLALAAVWSGEKNLVLFSFLDSMPVFFHTDAAGGLFVTVLSVVWLAATFYAFVYMRHEGEEKRYFGFWLLLYGILVGLDFSGNLITMYFFYELTTLASMPLVLHNGTREAIMAALKYLFYSMCGAYGGVFGIYFLYRYCDSLTFTPGGTLNMAAVQGHEGILLAAVFAMLVGFGAKAGMLPLHSWLPTAHPAAPSPASAALSAVIVKAGVLAIVRVVFYIVGPAFIRGTWVQYTWMALTLLTIFMGSLLAYREQVFKKRLAYSTVSQVSYILFGLSLLNGEAMTGALFHVALHAVVKCGLFLTAGIFLYRFGYTKVGQLAGMGKRMPKTMWCFLILSLALTGIPPAGGFISKWHLALGSLRSPVGIFSWLGPVALLVSALLTAGYLFPIALKGFFPGESGPEPADTGEKFSGEKLSEEKFAGGNDSFCMFLPIGILAALALFMGIFPNPLLRCVSDIASSVL